MTPSYLLAYFRTSCEALHLALSVDGHSWIALNGNLPILAADVGQRSVRDPFLFRGLDGRFHLLSTDSFSSVHLLHTASSDLVSWDSWTVLPGMESVPGARNAWAPKVWVDQRRKTHMVYWSSTTQPNVISDGNIWWDDAHDHRIWYSDTLDFQQFTPPRLVFDPQYSVIDALLLEREDGFVLIYKDERGDNRDTSRGKALHVALAATLDGPFVPQPEAISPPLSEGPAVFQHAQGWTLLFDHFMDGRWGAAHSPDLLAWQPLPAPLVPEGARHGSVLELSALELEPLLKCWC
jgi:hypothetical protein